MVSTDLADGGYMTLDLKSYFSLEAALEILKQPALEAYQFSIGGYSG
jgi:hypothetical protein